MPASSDMRSSIGEPPSVGMPPSIRMRPSIDMPWFQGVVDTPVGEIPRVSTNLTRADRLGSWKARWKIGRGAYRVAPGLYSVGNATQDARVFVSANYKMSFDRLRSQLGGRDAWILVLDTKGINVWCAAGEGTFGTDEIVNRVDGVRLSEVVSHRTLVLPQLGAPGVAAHEVARRCGFRVVYGPVRAEDIPAFIEAGMKATPQMRRVRFALYDRVALIPGDLAGGAKRALLVAAGFLLLTGLGPGVYSTERVIAAGLPNAVLLLAAFVAGVVATPILLPWLPGRSFSVKGVSVGFALILALVGIAQVHPGLVENWLSAGAWILMIPAITSYLAMDFTGSSTYTSLSGVRREMRMALPLQVVAATSGVALWLAGRFF